MHKNIYRERERFSRMAERSTQCGLIRDEEKSCIHKWGRPLTVRLPEPGICPNLVVRQFSKISSPPYILPTVSFPVRSSANDNRWCYCCWDDGTENPRNRLNVFQWKQQMSANLPESGGINLSVTFLACRGHSFWMVTLSSLSAWSISSAGRIFIDRFSRINANSVEVKLTLPSSVNGIFMRISFL